MRRNAGVADADNRMLAAEAADGGAAAAGLALVAGLVGVIEIRAARPLQQIARGGRLVAQLAGGAGHQRARQHGIVAPHARIGGKIGVADQRADAQAAVRRRLDPVEAEVIDVDQMLRRLDLQLHQIEQIGAAGDEFGALGAQRGRGGVRGRARALIAEGSHAFLPATSVIASAMLE